MYKGWRGVWGRRGVICIRGWRGVFVGRERCGEERVKRNNRRQEMTREEKIISVEKRVMD